MEYPKTVIDLKEAGKVVLDAMTNENTKRVLDKESDEFRRGAIWGMSWAAIHIMANCTQYQVKFGDSDKKEYRHPRDETPPYR